MDNSLPAMSLVTVTPDNYQTLRKTISHLKPQKGIEQCELVIVCASKADLNLAEADMAPFHSHQIIEGGPMHTTGPLRAMGVVAAKADVIAFVEDHCYPQPGWAQAFMDRHKEAWDAVGPNFGNANPWSYLSWVYIFMGFGPCIHTAGGPGTYSPWHNTSYKKAALLHFGDRLADLLDVEGFLMADLLSRGGTMYLEHDAKTLHINSSKWKDWAEELFIGGRVYGSRRSRDFSFGKKMFHAATACAIPLVRLSRLVKEVKRAGKSDLLPWIIPTLFIGLCVHALGEFTGYALGAGDSVSQFSWTEFHRETRLRQSDKDKLAASIAPVSDEMPQEAESLVAR